MMPRNMYTFIPPVINDPIQTGALSVYECAVLSNDVYLPWGGELPPGWSRRFSSPFSISGYMGRVYFKTLAPNRVGIAIAHRGTVCEFKDAGSVLADFSIMCNNVPLFQHNVAFNFLEKEVFPVIQALCKDEKIHVEFIINTGHSLGGVLADIFSGSNLPSITFENPGSKEIWKSICRNILQSRHIPPAEIEQIIERQLSNMSKELKAYQADINAINCCNEQIGQTFAIQPMNYDFVFNNHIPLALEEINPSFYRSLDYYFLSYTMHQHQIIDICNKLKGKHTITPVNYPFGFQKGYKAYLDYSSRQRYWDDYIQFYWNENYENTQTDFEGDFVEFKKEFIKQLKGSHDNLTANLNVENSILLNQHGLFAKNLKDTSSELLEDDFVMMESNNNEDYPLNEKQNNGRVPNCIVM